MTSPTLQNAPFGGMLRGFLPVMFGPFINVAPESARDAAGQRAG